MLKIIRSYILVLIICIPLTCFSTEGYYDLYYFDNQNIKIDEESIDHSAEVEIEDPFQPINQIIFSFNYVVDTLIIEPTAYFYKTITPDPVQGNVRNFFHNLSTPITAINLLLQGRFDDTAETIGRFITNSTIGVGGLFDIATEFNVEEYNEDFGLTMASYGVENGPYIVLPIIGPTNLRDLVGKGADFFIDPVNKNFSNTTNMYLGMTKIVYIRADNYALINNIKYKSLDPYTFMKTVYSQNRASRTS